MEELRDADVMVAQAFEIGRRRYDERLSRAIGASQEFDYPVASVCRAAYRSYLKEVLGLSESGYQAEIDKITAYLKQDKDNLASDREVVEWFGMAPLITLDIALARLSDETVKRQLLTNFVSKASTHDSDSSLHSDCSLDGFDSSGAPECSCQHSGICPAKTTGYLLLQPHVEDKPYDTVEHGFDPLGAFRDTNLRFEVAEHTRVVGPNVVDWFASEYNEWWLQQPGHLEAAA